VEDPDRQGEMTDEVLRLERRPSGDDGASVLAVYGEIDMATADALRAALDDLRAAAPDQDLRIDCAGLLFIDSSGLSVLTEARKQLDGEGRKLVLVNLRQAQREILKLTGLDQVLVLE
jgi:anti-anti-sigma factor